MFTGRAPSAPARSGTAPTAAPVTIQAGRFYAGGRPYFPTTNYLTSNAPYPFTQAYFSNQLTNAQRAAILQTMQREGFNAICLYTLNGGDYNDKPVSPYTASTPAGTMGGNFDEAKLQQWHAEMQTMIYGYGLRPILWLFSDDSPNIANASETEHRRYMEAMVRHFDDLPVLWVLGLEVDEYWDRAYVDRLGSYLQTLAQNPVGVHQLPNQIDYMKGAWVEFAVYQYGFDIRDNPDHWQRLYDETKLMKAALGNRAFIAGEYDGNRDMTDEAEAERIGAATAFAGAAGATNGAPPCLDELMAMLPDGMTASREGATLTLVGGGITATAEISNVNALRYTICECGTGSTCSGVPGCRMPLPSRCTHYAVSLPIILR